MCEGFPHGRVIMHTFSAMYLHVVFATWSRQRFLTAQVRPGLHGYLASTLRGLQVRDVHAGGHDDHVHILGRFPPSLAPADLIGQLKKSSSDWMRADRGMSRFRWQRGYGVFSVSRDRVPQVIRYIQRQEEHHRRVTLADELGKLLAEFGVTLEDANLL